MSDPDEENARLARVDEDANITRVFQAALDTDRRQITFEISRLTGHEIDRLSPATGLLAGTLYTMNDEGHLGRPRR